jgi:hypothetical protein
MRSGAVTIALVAACGAPGEPALDDDLAMFFRMDETGDGPRIDHVGGVHVYPWQRLGPGSYQQHGLGTTAVAGVVGDAQHVAGADGYHFASASSPVMDHGGDGFTWVGWASIDPPTTYLDNQTLVAKWTGVPDTEVPPDRREYRVWFEPALRTWRFEVSSDGLEGEGHSVIVTHPRAIEDDGLYFLEAWHDAEAQTVNLRISGRDAQGAVASIAWDRGVYTGDGDLDVGAQNQCADDHLQGTIDALGYWTRPLAEAERTALWNAGAGLEL